MEKITLWSEGYQATGEHSDATYHGTFDAIDLYDAVVQFRDTLTDEYSIRCINLTTLSFWGCKFYDNETDARKSFG